MKSLNHCFHRALAVTLAVLGCADAAFAQAAAPRPATAVAPAPATGPRPGSAPAPAVPAVAAATPGSTDLGDVEVIPSRANVTLFRHGSATCSESVVRFRVRSKAAGDLKLVLFRANFSATDANGGQLFKDGRHFVSGGVGISDIDPAQRQSAFKSEQGKLVTLAPRQLIEIQVTTQPSYPHCVPDPNEELMRSYRPKTASVALSLGLVDVSGTGDVKSVSLLDMPLQVGTR